MKPIDPELSYEMLAYRLAVCERVFANWQVRFDDSDTSDGELIDATHYDIQAMREGKMPKRIETNQASEP
jgi:hypothetical protein